VKQEIEEQQICKQKNVQSYCHVSISWKTIGYITMASVFIQPMFICLSSK